MRALQSNDTLTGGIGRGELAGGNGNDRLTGGAGRHYLAGLRRNDIMASNDRKKPQLI